MNSTIGNLVRTRVRKTARGQTFVEFAGIALAALSLMFVIFVCAMTIYAYDFVSNAARDAVRYAIVHGSQSMSPATSDDIQQYVDNMAYGLNTSDISVSTTWDPNNDAGSTVTVQVTYDFQPFYPFVTTKVPMTSTSQMVISH